jgi:hypothetical protein
MTDIRKAKALTQAQLAEQEGTATHYAGQDHLLFCISHLSEELKCPTIISQRTGKGRAAGQRKRL